MKYSLKMKKCNGVPAGVTWRESRGPCPYQKKKSRGSLTPVHLSRYFKKNDRLVMLVHKLSSPLKNISVMGKDKEGNYYPPKGKPSRTKARKGVTTTNSSRIDQQLEIEDKYTHQPDIDELAANVKVRHPNRNADKGVQRKVTENHKSAVETFNDTSAKNISHELPAFLSKETFQELANYTSECCVSIYIPTHRSGVEVNEQMDAISFKNALQHIESGLKSRQIDVKGIERILKPAYELLHNDKFWYELSESLAVFVSDGFFRYIKLPSRSAEKTLINSSFYLSPLVPFISSREYFFLLIISKKQAKLFRAHNFGMEQVEVKELPNGVDDVVHFEEKDDHKLFRTGSSGAGEGANYHGIGAGKPDEKENISIYLEEVDETLWKELLNNEHVPLLLAGVEYLLPLYKKVTHYNNVWDRYLTGNVEHVDSQQLFKQARELMEPYFQERVNKAKESFGNQSSTALTSSIPEEIIPAAYYSRVSYLFVQKDAQIWGKFDEQENTLVIHKDYKMNDDSLLDKAILKTIMNGGDVFILEKNEMPIASIIAAVMRY